MLTQTDPDLTLPSFVASLAGRYGPRDPALTIIFHPDTSRIGERAVIPRLTGQEPWTLGRYHPTFMRLGGAAPEPLQDLHISRRALQFEAGKRCLVVTRFDGSSRCRVGRAELHGSISIDWDRLANGVPLLLGHGIVLLLHLHRDGLQPPPRWGTGRELLGTSGHISDVRVQIERAAQCDLDVLILGETGTGKELAARAIHRASHRKDAPMISVNMAAVPRELAAAALFGSARGAFTGADRASPGYFGQAEGGTLFLDEIGDTPAEVQPQLLRALQQREVQVVGGAVRKVDVRVISATDARLDSDDSNFRDALRFRLAAFEINLPPLRDHPEDIGELLLHFLQRSATENRRDSFPLGAGSAASAVAAWAVLFYKFLQYSWPGNVRQLENFANQVVLSSERMPTLSPGIRRLIDAAHSDHTGVNGGRRSLQDVEEDAFDQAMSDNDFEVRRAAATLGVSRAAVYRRIARSTRYRLANEITPRELNEALQTFGGDVAALSGHFRVSLNSLRRRLRDLGLDRP